MENSTNTGFKAPQKNSKKRWFFLGLGLASASVLSFFCFQYWKKNKKQETSTSPKAPGFKAEKPTVTGKPGKSSAAPKKTAHQTANPAHAVSPFPLKSGSKGDKVKALQQALIDKYGSKILAKGADGVFGPDVEGALKKLSLPLSIDETLFNVLVQKPDVNTTGLATGLYTAILAQSFSNAVKLLKMIKSTADYKAVSDAFSKYKVHGVHQTLVTGLLTSFTSAQQKETLRLALSAIGLKYNGQKWSLSGIDKKTLLITTKPAMVWKDPKTSVPVPLNMVLGREVAKRGTFTLFENDAQYFLVESKNVKNYKA